MTRNRPAILCLGGGIESLPIIRKVDSLGFCPIVLDGNGQAPAVEWARRNPKSAMAWQADVYSPGSVNAAVPRVFNHSAMHSEIVGVLCTATDTPDSQAVLAKIFRTPSIGVESAILAKDKWEQYQWLHKHNIPVPPTKLVDINTPPSDAEGYHVIKPITGRGARGVTFFNANTYRAQLIGALGHAPQNNKFAIIQKFLPGVQLSTESVIQHGHILFTGVFTRNYTRDEYLPYIIEDGIDGPHWLNPEHYRNLNALILKASLCMGWDNCTVKGDIVMDKGAFFIIELAPRLSGGYLCTHSIPMAYGYDFLRSAIQLVVGKLNRPRDDVDKRHVCQRYIFPKPEWIGKKITTISASIDTPDTFATFHKYPGYRILPVRSHADRLGQCVVVADSEIGAQNGCELEIELALDQIKVQ